MKKEVEGLKRHGIVERCKEKRSERWEKNESRRKRPIFHKSHFFVPQIF